ncbi:hypothetical protein AVDCRST_MAG84-2037 [uncultured Microcoleus sp.]|uniref:Uncharacterized protein n=1 Tax=uncultured Microcoleus sp. TaxID=259945 RepID=A0A6J4LID2_9CYAN|nr:hypothetical protein AVDCRST_MAG84-2037 [uncultured Microcoleus sp.]
MSPSSFMRTLVLTTKQFDCSGSIAHKMIHGREARATTNKPK